jgi:dTDP-4-dehydrorhamnose reductase
MRIVVTGKEGQLARSLVQRAESAGASVLCIGRPELDLEKPETIALALDTLAPDVVVNAAAYTAVDQAEREADRAMAINATGAGVVADAAAKLSAPVIQISTDYVFDGKLPRPYLESEPTTPLGVYGTSKLKGEELALQANRQCVVLRTAWVYSPFGKNFVRTMLRLAQTQDEIAVVSDQIGSPTSGLSLADTILAVARNLATRPGEAELFGVFHAVDGGEATWAQFATAIFARSAAIGGPAAKVKEIATSQFPTLAPRPANSRLATERLKAVHGIDSRHWRDELIPCVDLLVARDFANGKRP